MFFHWLLADNEISSRLKTGVYTSICGVHTGYLRVFFDRAPFTE